ncbi:hypothetical protein AVEN_5298-1 [Araneus ventricosus]|uniref:Uncharacterized protein n=1 Tax=Araneus ventricosus TaxID=182803 RepID=A0A4Y2CYD5_ARAVE|nr:hypothetical protein AVEN_5298-1 [Araneus ventricosus]
MTTKTAAHPSPNIHVTPKEGHFTFDIRFKAGHSLLFQNGIFGTREGKTNHQGRKPAKFGTNDLKWWNSKELRRQFTPFPNWKFWNTGRKKQQSV